MAREDTSYKARYDPIQEVRAEPLGSSPGCVTVGKLPDFSEPLSLVICKTGVTTHPRHRSGAGGAALSAGMGCCDHRRPGMGGAGRCGGRARWATSPLRCPGYEEVVWIPKGSVHIFIQDLNFSLSHLGEPDGDGRGLGDSRGAAWWGF